jgi:hypothetical protein
MLKRDLTTGYPRSVRDKLLGVVQLARAIDKGIATANGLNGEYNFDCPMDKRLFEFLGLDGNALLDVIKNAQTESDVEAYVKPFVDKKSPHELEHFNDEFLSHGPQPGSDAEKYFLELRGQVAPDRTDVSTWPDLLDLDEKRAVPQRVPA